MRGWPLLVAPSLLAIGAMIAFPVALHAKLNFSLGTSDRNGVCGVDFPFDDNKDFEISIKASNGNVNVAVHNLDPNFVDNALDRDPTFNMTLIIDDGTSVASDFAAYRAGMSYRAMGAWREVKSGHPIITKLKTATSMEVQFEEERFGPIPTQVPGLGYNLLESCVKGHGGVMPG